MDKNTSHSTTHTATEKIGDRIKKTREKIGLSQSDVSRLMHLTRGVCGQWERGIANPSTAHLSKLAVILETSVEYLASGTTNQNISTTGTDNTTILTAKLNTLFIQLPTHSQKIIVQLLDDMVH